MGEKIKDVGQVTIGGSNFKVEINKATTINGPRYIHIQNCAFRYCLTEKDFLQFASEIMKAKKNFTWRKGIKDD